MLSRSAVLIALVMAVVLGAAWGAGPAIGIATASGDFRIDRTSVSGNATILDGSLIETGRTGSELRLYEGTSMRLAGDSRGKVFQSRLVLEQGAAQVDARKGYAVDVAGFRVQAAPHSAAEIDLTGTGGIEVAAISGAVQVKNGTGVLLAQVPPGKALAFAMQASGAAPPEKLTGVLTESKGHYFLTDQTAGVRVELVGSDLDKLVGKVVEVTGTLDTTAQAAESASHVVDVISIKGVSTGGAAKAAAASGGHHTAIIAGAAVAATGGGIAAAVAWTGGPSSISR